MEEKRTISESVYNLDIGDVRVSVVKKDDAFKTGLVDKTGDENSTFWLKSIHSHADREIFFVLNGSLDVFTEEGSSSYSRKVIVIPSGFNHYTLSHDNNCYVLRFDIGPAQNKSEELYENLNEAFSKGVRVLPLTENTEFYVKRLSEAFVSTDPFDEITLKPLLTLIFQNVFSLVYSGNFATDVPDEKTGRANHGRYVSLIETYLQKNYAEKINLTTLAGELYLSTKQVSRIIKKEYNCTFSELINRKRMSAACMLLKNTDMKISDIIKQLNYTSENYFYVLFKKYYGVSPRKYRE